jgi:hypothetical protein
MILALKRGENFEPRSAHLDPAFSPSWSDPKKAEGRVLVEEDFDFLPDLPSPSSRLQPEREVPRERRSSDRTDAYSAVLRKRSTSPSFSSTSHTQNRGYHSSVILRSALGNGDEDGIGWRVPSEKEYARYDRDKREARRRSWSERERPAGVRRERSDEYSERVAWTRPVRERETSFGPVPVSGGLQVERPFQRQDDITRQSRPPRRQTNGNYTAQNYPRSNTIARTTVTNPPEPTPEQPRPDHRWAPTKRLSRPAMAGIKRLHAEDPIKYSRAILSKSFGVSVEAIARILKSDGRWYKAEDGIKEGGKEGLIGR